MPPFMNRTCLGETALQQVIGGHGLDCDGHGAGVPASGNRRCQPHGQGLLS